MNQPRRAGRWAAALLGLAVAAAANPSQQQIQTLEESEAAQLAAGRQAALRQQAAEADAKRLAETRVATLASLRATEQATAEAANTVARLARRRAEAEARLQARSAQLAPLLPVIERLSLYPAETLLAVPSGPRPSLTGLLVLKGMTRQLEAEALALRAEQAEVAQIGNDMARQEARLTDAQSAQASQAAGLDRQIADAQARSRDAEDAAAGAARRAAEQAGQAQTLRAALNQLQAAQREEEARARADVAQAERQRREAAATEARRREAALAQPAGPGLAEGRGQLGAPVTGAVVKAFGETSDGGAATGISYAAPPASRVAAPCGGRVVFAGPFRSFGRLMIIDCGGGYHFVLAGLDRLDVAVGLPVQPGEPVGVMPAWDPRAGGTRPLLYVELRERGQPINPAPYLRGRS